MAKEILNGIELYWQESAASGEPLVLVHGGFVDHNHWRLLTPFLQDTFRVLTYDRRGHSRSGRSAGIASVSDDAADLAALLTYLDAAPAHVLGHSHGAVVVLSLAADQPELFRSMMLHEPPVFALNEATAADRVTVQFFRQLQRIATLIESGETETGARLFVDAAFGPDAWDQLLDDSRRLLISNAGTFVDDMSDPVAFTVDLSRLRSFSQPILLTQGADSPRFLQFMTDQLQQELPQAQGQVIPGAGHSPHVSQPQAYADVIRSFLES